MGKILIANSSRSETDQLREVLGSTFDIVSIETIEQYNGDLEGYKLLLLDHNFTEFHGLDFLKKALSNHHLPVLFLSPENDSRTAAKSLSNGVTNFIVKTGDHYKILPFAIKESIQRFNEQQNMQQLVISLKARITELEAQLADKLDAAPAPTEVVQPDKNSQNGIFADVVEIIKSGDVNLPAYPEISKNFNQIINQGASIREITSLLQKDPGISSKMISVSNSAYYQGMSPVKTLEQAIGRIGITETRNYVELISNRGLYIATSIKYKDYLDKLWEHSLACAYACQELSKKLQVKVPAELFTMGLFHDIGKLLLIQVISELESREKYNTGVPEKDWQDLVYKSHGQFGASLMKKWKLADEYSQITRWHENPEAADNISKELLIVNLANLLAKSIGYSEIEEDLTDIDIAIGKQQRLMLTTDQIEEIKESIINSMQAGLVI